MKTTILIIDDQKKLSQILQKIVNTEIASIEDVTDFVSAKVKLINLKPQLVIAKMTMNGNSDAGCNFCQGLKEHQQLSTIPVFLVEENISDEAIRKASSHGAKGLLPWPIPVNTLRTRLNAIIPGIISEENKITEKPISPTSPQQQSAQQQTNNDNLQYAQQLLAKVLHDLKTSDLLQVSEKEDVPQIVYEITRKICGIKSPEKQPVLIKKTQVVNNPEDNEVNVDISKIFTLK